MGVKSELETSVKAFFSSKWTTRESKAVPTDDTSIALANDGVEIEATVLYADLSGSTNLVDNYPANFSAGVYKAYLHCAAKIIRSETGEITAYDGDRIMAVFIGDRKNSSAVRAAMKINFAVRKLINPAIIKTFGENKYTVKQVVGIDTSKLLVAKTGIRGANDLVWVGRAANYAAKLSSLTNYDTFITDTVYNHLSEETKFVKQGSEKTDMWTPRIWKAMNDMTIYGSGYHWELPD